jgi:hypothetical protein
VREGKRCKDCHMILPVSSFNRDRTKKDGLDWRCRKCSSIREKSRPSHSYRQRAYEKKYPQKKKAHFAVKDAIIRGVLQRLPCEICGNPKAHAHHDDYSKPLEVRWLCPQHHVEHHRPRKVVAAERAAGLDLSGYRIRIPAGGVQAHLVPIGHYKAICLYEPKDSPGSTMQRARWLYMAEAPTCFKCIEAARKLQLRSQAS